MIASHNQKSIERAVSLMHEINVEPSKSGIYFGQLLGMADHLSFILGQNGYRVSPAVLSGLLGQVSADLFKAFMCNKRHSLKVQYALA